jgi:hypothetical protein
MRNVFTILLGKNEQTKPHDRHSVAVCILWCSEGLHWYIWLGARCSGGLLWTRWWTFGCINDGKYLHHMKHYRLTNGTMAKLHNEARFSSKSFNLSKRPSSIPVRNNRHSYNSCIWISASMVLCRICLHQWTILKKNPVSSQRHWLLRDMNTDVNG